MCDRRQMQRPRHDLRRLQGYLSPQQLEDQHTGSQSNPPPDPVAFQGRTPKPGQPIDKDEQARYCQKWISIPIFGIFGDLCTGLAADVEGG